MTTTQRYYVAHVRVGTWRVYKPTGDCLKYDFTSEPSAAFWADQLNEAMRRGDIEQQKQAGTAVSIEVLSGLWDHLQWAWGIIANAGGGNWEKESKDWQESASRWREAYHAMLSRLPKDDPRLQGPIAIKLLEELRAWLDQQLITGESIGTVRRACFVPWDSTWNTIVREETAKREKFIPIVHIRDDPAKMALAREICKEAKQARDLPKESLPEFGKEVTQQQPMTATEFPIGILIGWMQEVTAVLDHIGRENNARYPQVFIGLEAFQNAAREKGLL